MKLQIERIANLNKSVTCLNSNEGSKYQFFAIEWNKRKSSDNRRLHIYRRIALSLSLKEGVHLNICYANSEGVAPHYLHSKYSDEHPPLVPAIQRFPSETGPATSSESNPPPSQMSFDSSIQTASPNCYFVEQPPVWMLI